MQQVNPQKNQGLIIIHRNHFSFKLKPFSMHSGESPPFLNSVCAEADVVIQDFNKMCLSKYESYVCTDEKLIGPKYLMSNKQNPNKTTILEEKKKTINVRTNEELKELKLGSSLASEEEEQVTPLLKEIKVVCAKSYKDMPWMD